MARIIIVLFISLIPVFIYCFLYNKEKQRAIKLNLDRPAFITERLLKSFIQFLVIASIFFVVFIVTSLYEDKPGVYIPAKVIDGKIERGHIE
jgi:hypothetical protein